MSQIDSESWKTLANNIEKLFKYQIFFIFIRNQSNNIKMYYFLSII